MLGLLAGRNRGISYQRGYRLRSTPLLPATGDESFARNVGIDILVETARLWRSLGHFDLDGNFRIDGVTGPDEYSAIADNNIYTNMMARRNLRGAAAACERYPERANELGVPADEISSWRNAADHVVIPYDDKLGVHQQSEGFTHHELWNFETTKGTQYPLMLHFPYVELYRKQVVKQPDLILAMHVCYDSFTPEQRARNFDYYERITVRDSSLSAGTEAVAAADAGYVRLAFDYATEAALLDLEDFEHNTRDGLHLASLAGAWIAFVFGLGGMRGSGDILEFTPRLPDGLTRLKFSLLHRSRRLCVEVTTGSTKFTLPEGEGTLHLLHHGEPLTLTGSESIVCPNPRPPEHAEPSQPPGRAPRRRSAA